MADDRCRWVTDGKGGHRGQPVTAWDTDNNVNGLVVAASGAARGMAAAAAASAGNGVSFAAIALAESRKPG